MSGYTLTWDPFLLNFEAFDPSHLNLLDLKVGFHEELSGWRQNSRGFYSF